MMNVSDGTAGTRSPRIHAVPGIRDAVDFTGVVKRYGQVLAVNGVDIHIKTGEMAALLGPNGAGKSTTIGMMLGLLRPDAGRISILGGSPEAAVSSGRVGAMLQQGGLLPGVTVRELIDFMRGLYPKPLRIDDVLARAGLTEIAKRPVEKLSGGQAQRVRFAMAIAGNPELIFLDEPTTGMDVESRRAFWESMRSFAAEGRTVLFATHYLEEADAVADLIIVLSHGRVVADDSATGIKSAVAVRRVRFTLPNADIVPLRSLPGVTGVEAHGDSVQITTNDSDATVRALCATGVPFDDLEVTGAGLEEAFITLTQETVE